MILLTTAIYKLKVALWLATLLTIVGYFIWSFTEYFIHRYLLHYVPLFRTGHEKHHAHPKSLLGTPTWLTLTAYLLIAWGIAAIIGYGITACLLAGFIGGYYVYVNCHHVVHHWSIKPNTFRYRYKKFHSIHHYRKNVNFGVVGIFGIKFFAPTKNHRNFKLRLVNRPLGDMNT